VKHIANRNDLLVRKESSILSRDVKGTWNGSSIVYRAVRGMKNIASRNDLLLRKEEIPQLKF